MGRVFSAEEEQPGREGVAVISDAFWRRRFDADPGILNKTIRLDGADGHRSWASCPRNSNSRRT